MLLATNYSNLNTISRKFTILRNFKVWQQAMEVTVKAYVLTSSFPKEEKFGLKSQIQRSAVSIPSNIAEGCGRVSGKELQHFVSISMGSSYELETQVTLAYRFNYISEEQLRDFELLLIPVQKNAIWIL